MISRRKFLQNTGALAVGSLAVASSSSASPFFNTAIAPIPAGIQLYTFTRKGGYYGLKPKEFAAKAKEFGMTWRAHHCGGAPFRMPAGATPPVGPDGKPLAFPPMKNLRDNFQEVVDDCAEGGVQYLVCSSTPIDTLDDVKKSIETFNKTGEACKKVGITFAFHNHVKE